MIILYELIRIYCNTNIQCYVQVRHISLFLQFHRQLKTLANRLEVDDLKLSAIYFYFINIKNGNHLTLDIETGIEAEY